MEHKEKHNLTFICDLCGFVGKTRDSLREHTLNVHESTPVPCPLCGKVMKNEAALKAHKKKVHNAAPCPICGTVVKNLKFHMEEMHTANSEKKFHCQDCGKGFMTKQRIESHRMNNHLKTQPYQCRYGCENSYNDRSNRNAHEKRRHGAVLSGQPENSIHLRAEGDECP